MLKIRKIRNKEFTLAALVSLSFFTLLILYVIKFRVSQSLRTNILRSFN